MPLSLGLHIWIPTNCAKKAHLISLNKIHLLVELKYNVFIIIKKKKKITSKNCASFSKDFWVLFCLE